MRSRTQCLTAFVLLLCLVWISGSGAWALPGPAKAPTLQQRSSVLEDLWSWIAALFERGHKSPATPDPGLPHLQANEGPQMDPNGNH